MKINIELELNLMSFLTTKLQNYSNYIGSRIRDLTPFYSYSRFPPSFDVVVASIDSFYS
jgi:hypothetical protein